MKEPKADDCVELHFEPDSTEYLFGKVISVSEEYPKKLEIEILAECFNAQRRIRKDA